MFSTAHAMSTESDSRASPNAEEDVRLHRWANEIFSAAVRLDPAERSRYLDAACRNDRALREEVEALLAHDADREIVGRTVPRRVLEILASMVKTRRRGKD